jgi:hypothetical protein
MDAEQLAYQNHTAMRLPAAMDRIGRSHARSHFSDNLTSELIDVLCHRPSAILVIFNEKQQYCCCFSRNFRINNPSLK